MASTVVKRSNLVVSVREYVDKNGEGKKVWKTIGELTTFKDDKGDFFAKAELYHMPGTSISVFEQKEKGSNDEY